MAATWTGSLLELPGPVPETIATFLSPAARKVLRLTCKDARHLVDRTVRSATVDVDNVRTLCGPWRPLHAAFPQLRHLSVSLRSTGAVTWDASRAPAPGSTAAAAAGGGGGGGGQLLSASQARSSGRVSGGPAAAAASYSLRLLRDCVPRLRYLSSLDLTHCYLDPPVWRALCGCILPRSLSLRLHPAAALLFPGKSWADRLRTMLGEMAAVRPDIRVSVVACSSGGGSISAGGAACWCDVDGEAGLVQLADMPYICELAMCVWSRAPCQSDWLLHLSSLTRLQRLHISCCNATDPWDHTGLAGLAALASLRELSIGLTDSPLRLTDLAPLTACTSLTALSVGWLAPPPGAAALAAQAGDRGGGGGGITPLLSVRRLEVRCCLSAGPLPLYDLAPAAVSVSLCAISIGGGSRVVSGHALTSLIKPDAPTPLQHPPQRQQPALLPPLPQPRQTSQSQSQSYRLPAPLPPAPLLLQHGLRSLELVQREAAAMSLGPAGEGTGRLPLPGAEMLSDLVALEHLQFTGWRLRGAQLPGLLATAQRLPRLRRLTLRDCDEQSFGWRATRAAQLGRGLGLQRLDRLVGLRLRALEHIEVLGAPSLQLLEQLALACRAPSLRRIELHGVANWDERVFQRILGTASRAAAAVAANANVANAAAAARTHPGGHSRGSSGGSRSGGGATGIFFSGTSRVLSVLAAAANAVAASSSAGCRLYDRRAVLCPQAARPTFPGGTTAGVSAVGSGQQQQLMLPAVGARGVVRASNDSRVRALRASTGGASDSCAVTGRSGSSTSSSSTGSGSGGSSRRVVASGEGSVRRSGGGRSSGSGSGATSSDEGSGTEYGGRTGCYGARWPYLEHLVVHGCGNTSMEGVKRQAGAAGLGPWLQVEWMANTLALGRETWVGEGGVGMGVGTESRSRPSWGALEGK